MITEHDTFRQLFYWLYGLPEWASSLVLIVASISILFIAWFLHDWVSPRRKAQTAHDSRDESILILGIAGSVLGIALTLLLHQLGKDYLVTVLSSEPPTASGTGSRETSPLGMNLSPVVDDGDEFPFLDLFKTSRDWMIVCESGEDAGCNAASEPGEPVQIDLDQDGWVRHLPAGSTSTGFRPVATIIKVSGEPASQANAGRFVVLHDGEGELLYSHGGTKISGTPGRDVISVEPAGSFQLTIARTDPADSGNYLRHIRVVREEHEPLLTSQPFNPAWLAKLESFRTLRFMEWMRTNESGQGDFDSRPGKADARYTSAKGVPLELMVDLANTTDSEPWFNLPHKATDDYARHFAELVKSTLKDGLKIYVEYSNEVWNDAFPQGRDMETWAQAELPYASESLLTQRLNWYGKRSGEVCKIWREVFGAQADRIICVLGAQASNSWTATQALECPLFAPSLGQSCQELGLNAVAIAPYFGGYLGEAAFRFQVRQLTPDQLFEELNLGGVVKDTNPADSARVPDGGALAESYRWMDDYDSLASAKNLRILGYAGGQHLVGVGDVQKDALIEKLFKAANQDRRMGDVYLDYLNHWRSEPSGKFEVFVPYVLAQRYGKQGSWGLLEHIEQASSPKFDALSTFAAMNACWWPDCSLHSSDGTAPVALAMPVLAAPSIHPGTATPSSKPGKRTPLATTAAMKAFTNAMSGNDQTIYDESLAANWSNWSWGTNAVFTNTTTKHNGVYSIAVTYSKAWAGFYLHTSSSIDTRLFDRIEFWIHGGASGSRELKLVVNGNSSAAKKLSAPAGAWTQFTLPFSELGNPQTVSEFYLQEASGTLQPEFFIDDIKLLKVPPPELTLTVDGGLERHKISDDIYGMNFAEEALAKELRLPVNRWGGNRRSRYNWKSSMTNTGRDWFYETLQEGTVNVANLPAGSASDQFIDQNLRTGTKSIMTLPMIGWVAKSTSPRKHPYDCSFKVSKYGAQQEVDNWDKDCGNGIRADGTLIQNNDPNAAHEFINKTDEAVDQGFVADWLKYLTNKYKPADQGGVSLYSLDNEPMLWHSNHRDVHPLPVTYDEIRDLSYRHGAAIKAIDAKAKAMGPVVYGWCAYFHSAKDGCKFGADYQSHGNLPFIPWYLSQMQAYEQLHQVRILDYLDVHYYPQADDVALSGAGDAVRQALRLRTTRSLWDDTYTDESWVSNLDVNGVRIRVIRRMKEWINTYYPGTLLAISEYNWGGLESLNGALAQADVLGIFGREGVDLATIWSPPAATEPGAFAFRMYRNYDGLGHRFGDIGLSATSNDTETVSIFAAQRSSDNALTLMVINKSGEAVSKPILIKGLEVSGKASVYRYSGDNLAAIVKLDDVAISGGNLATTLPASSITLFVLPAATNLTTLSVTKAGSGNGEVTANVGGLNWNGTTGSDVYAPGTSVCLTANPDAESSLGGWSGCDPPNATCVQANQCLVSLRQSRNLSVTFARKQYQLTVKGTGASGGAVSSSTNLLSFTYPDTSGVTATMTHGSGTLLTASGNDLTVAEWLTEGCDAVRANGNVSQCEIKSMTADRSVTAAFKPLTCTFRISPTSKSFARSGGSGTIAVTASNSACQWPAINSGSVAWVTLNPGPYQGSRGITYSVARNDTRKSRSALISIAGISFTITQSK